MQATAHGGQVFCLGETQSPVSEDAGTFQHLTWSYLKYLQMRAGAVVFHLEIKAFLLVFSLSQPILYSNSPFIKLVVPMGLGDGVVDKVLADLDLRPRAGCSLPSDDTCSVPRLQTDM